MASLKKRGPKPGAIWDSFTQQNDGSMLCQLILEDGSPCTKSFGKKLTSNAEHHVKMYNPIDWEEIDSSKKEKITQKISNVKQHSQQTIEQCFSKSTQEKFDDNLAKFFGATTVSYRLIEHPFFRNLILDLNRSVKLPKSHTTIYPRVEKLYRDVKQKLIQDLLVAKKVYLMADIWSKKGLTESFLGISAVFFSRTSHERRCVVLAVRQFPHPHTASNILKVYQDVSKEFGIDEQKVPRIVTDNGSNMVKCFTVSIQEAQSNSSNAETPAPSVGAAGSSTDDDILSYDQFGLEEELDEDEEMEEAFADCGSVDNAESEGEFDFQENQCFNIFGSRKHLPCHAHTLDLVARVIDSDVEFSALMDEFHHFTNSIAHSSYAKQIIRNKCGCSLPSIAKTRWTYGYFFCQALVRCQLGLDAYCDYAKRDRIPASHFEKLKLYIRVLEPFANSLKKFYDNKTKRWRNLLIFI